ASHYWQDTHYETHLQRGRREFAWLFGAITLYVAFVIIHQLEPLDWILWPLDNVLRLLDVGDMFQVFGWRLHRVQPTIWTSAAADAVDSLSQAVWLGHRELRLAATKALGRIGPEARCVAYSLLSLLKVCDGETHRVAIVALERIAPELTGLLPKRKRKAKKN